MVDRAALPRHHGRAVAGTAERTVRTAYAVRRDGAPGFCGPGATRRAQITRCG